MQKRFSDNHGEDEDDKIYIREMMTRKRSTAPYVIIMRKDNREGERWRRWSRRRRIRGKRSKRQRKRGKRSRQRKRREM